MKELFLFFFYMTPRFYLSLFFSLITTLHRNIVETLNLSLVGYVVFFFVFISLRRLLCSITEEITRKMDEFSFFFKRQYLDFI